MTAGARVQPREGSAVRAFAFATGSALVAALLAGFLAITLDVHGAAAASSAKKKSNSATKAKPSADPRDVVLARVGSTTITRGDFDDRLEQLPAQFKGQVSSPDQKRAFLDRMIEERVWLETSIQNGVEKRPEVQAQLENTRRDLLIRTYLSEAMAKAPAPSDSAIQAYYDGHLGEFMAEEQVKVRHIQVKDEKTAKQVQKELVKSGADFAALAKKYSVDAVTKDKGGDLGAVQKTGFFGSLGRQQALADTAFASPVGVVKGPIQTGLGWHFIEVTERIPAKARPLEEVTPLISRQMAQEGQQAFYQQSLAGAKAALHVSTDAAAVDSLVNAQKSAVDLFREAGEQPGPDDRIRAYRRVVELYPQDQYAPQALFMVGFVESEEKQDYDQADVAFRELIARYPNSELAASAQWMIDNMRSDKTPEFELPGDLGPASAKAGTEKKTP